MSDEVAKRLHARRPKRVLALDGGGTRGIVTVAFLERIEAVLRDKFGRPDLVLADYFDLVGGTSVGSLLATQVAMAQPMSEIRARFKDWSKDLFRGRTGLRSRFDAKHLERKIADLVGGHTMRSPILKTGLAIVAKRADTNSVWVVTNNPRSYYFEGFDETIGNGDYPILNVLRASTAAPTFFKPKRFLVSRGTKRSTAGGKFGIFVDGAVSPHNTPALKLFMLATVPGYNLGGAPIEQLKTAGASAGRTWDVGPENLLMISVGTGGVNTVLKPWWWLDPVNFGFSDGILALMSMIGDNRQLNVGLLQALSVPPDPTKLRWAMDSEAQDLSGAVLSDSPRLTFERYDVELELDWLSGRGHGRTAGPEVQKALEQRELRNGRDVNKLSGLIDVGAMADLEFLGDAAARDQVSVYDFPDAFDDFGVPGA